MKNLSEKLSILVVEDEDELRKIIAEFFEQSGHKIYEAIDGLQALDLMQKNPIDLVISDLGIPLGSGFTLLKAIKGQFKDKVDVILISGSTELSEEEALRAGALALLQKPFGFGEILDLLKP